MSCKFFSLSTHDDTRNACLHHIDERELATYLSMLQLLHDEYHPNKSPTHCLRVCPTATATTDPTAAAATGALPNMGGFASMLNSMAQDPSIREAAQGFANGDMSGLSGLLNNPAISQM